MTTSSPLGRVPAILRRGRVVGSVGGLLLLVAAIVVVVRSHETLERARSALVGASATTIILLGASVLASVALTGTVFWLLTRRFEAPGKRLAFDEMQALMAATTLANYLPLRPGLFGRVAFHRMRHEIRARDSLRTVFEAIALTGIALVALAGAIPFGRAIGVPLPATLAAPACVGVAVALVPRAHLVAVAWTLRYCEALLTALRYHLAFGLVGAEVSAETSCAVACVSMIASLVPFVSNGLGLREWAVGLLAPVLAGYSVEEGLTAELVNRAAEIAIVVPTGLLGFALLWRWSRAAPAATGRRPDPER